MWFIFKKKKEGYHLNRIEMIAFNFSLQFVNSEYSIGYFCQV